MKKKVVLKKGRDFPIRQFHPWIFSGAVASFPSCEAGDLLAVFSHDGEMLGHGYFNEKCSLIGRMVSFGAQDPYEAIKSSIHQAISLRKKVFDPTTTAYRLIHGEGDFLPGLVADLYGSCLVLQIATQGMEKLKKFVIEILQDSLSLDGIYEKSDLSVRELEGLERKEGVLWGNVPEKVEILENGIRFLISIPEGQKTGFFLDQRQMRAMVRELSFQKKVLNCFAYSGGFSLAAAAGKASQVDSVEISEKVLALAKENFLLNGLSLNTHGFYAEDVFDFLQEKPLDYDLVILDPPAFAKKREDLPSAMKGYQQLHRVAFEKMKKGSLLLTSSCSYHLSEELFQSLIFQMAKEKKRQIKILSSHHQAYDHPASLFHKEGRYLKSFLLALEDFF